VVAESGPGLEHSLSLLAHHRFSLSLCVSLCSSLFVGICIPGLVERCIATIQPADCVPRPETMPSTSGLSAAEKAAVKKNCASYTDKVCYISLFCKSPSQGPLVLIKQGPCRSWLPQLGAYIMLIRTLPNGPGRALKAQLLSARQSAVGVVSGFASSILLCVKIPFPSHAQLTKTFKKGTKGVMWEHELYDEFPFHQDRTFFHSFPGDVRSFFFALITILYLFNNRSSCAKIRSV
jgi:hypothetical protein